MSQEVFEEVKKTCMEVWELVDTDNDKYGYATEKKNRIKDLENVSDNGMYMIAMFDLKNQALVSALLSNDARDEVAERLAAGGTPKIYNPFL